jgi:tetratricopeptide (TPR) repeat protein
MRKGRLEFGVLLILALSGAVFAREFDPWNLNACLQSARNAYQTSGFGDYYQARTLLWTETTKRRGDLQAKLPVIAEERSKEFRLRLQQLLEINPDDQTGLIMAGDYHYYYRQRETARWYYGRAVELWPESLEAAMALADFYLYEYQPDQALQALRQFDQPRANLRRAAAHWLRAEYPLALGCLLQTEPPAPGEAAIATRDLLLAKTYLALGDTSSAMRWLKNEYPAQSSAGVLLRELRGWTAWTAGDSASAQAIWNEAKNACPEYRFWDGYLAWIQFLKTGLEAVSFNPKDGDLKSLVKLFSGYSYQRNGETLKAYQAFLEGIKNDHRSLIGFLEAGNLQLKQGKYREAADLFSQALAVNPGFGPILSRRATAYQRLNQHSKAEQDLAALSQSLKTSGKSILHGRMEALDDRTLLTIDGPTGNLFGVWTSPDGIKWQWSFWWGGPLRFPKSVERLWLVPSGPGLSGDALLIIKEGTNGDVPKISFETLPDGLHLHITPPASLVLVNSSTGRGLVAGEPSEAMGIPVGFYCEGPQEIRCWTRIKPGGWRQQRVLLHGPPEAGRVPAGVQFKMESLTNRRQIQLQAVLGDISVSGLQFAVYEAGLNEPGPWREFRNPITYQLSEGDGLKTLLVRIRDRAGNQTEERIETVLDTRPPEVKEFRIEPGEGGTIGFQWSSDEPVNAELLGLTVAGTWRKTVLSARSELEYDGSLNPAGLVYCRLALKDQAGNITMYNPYPLNQALITDLAIPFRINQNETEGLITRSRIIAVSPGPSAENLVWSVSNDLQVWSPWQTGTATLSWRLGTGDGTQLLYIRSRRENKTELIRVLPVQLDTVPPRPVKLELDRAASRLTIDFDEPVELASWMLGGQAVPLEPVPDWRTTAEFRPIPEGDFTIQLEVRDRAGNTSGRTVAVKDAKPVVLE